MSDSEKKINSFMTIPERLFMGPQNWRSRD
jgi:hypothetical protein